MKTLETVKQIHDPNNTGKVLYVPRKMIEVFHDLKEELEKSGLLPDEGISLSYGIQEDSDFPVIDNLFCNASWGSSEGIYIDVIIRAYDESEHSW